MVVLPTFFQPLLVLRWILTGTLAAHAVNVSPTLTTPLATRCFFSLSVTLLEWTVLTVKFAVLVAVPPGVVTLILPVVAPVGTVAVICVAEFTWNVVALVVLNFTELVVKVAPLTVPLKFVPVIVTDVPTGPKVGRERGDRRSRRPDHGEVRARSCAAPQPCTRGSDRSSPRRNDRRDRGRACAGRGDEARRC